MNCVDAVVPARLALAGAPWPCAYHGSVIGCQPDAWRRGKVGVSRQPFTERAEPHRAPGLTRSGWISSIAW